MTEDAQTVGTSGSSRWVTLLKRSLLATTAVVAVCCSIAAFTWWQVRDLRDLGFLDRAPGEVTEIDYRRGGADLAVVVFTVDGERVESRIPADGGIDAGERVEVAYTPGNPERARLVDGWAPAYEWWLQFAAFSVVAVPILVLTRRERGGPDAAGTASRQG